MQLICPENRGNLEDSIVKMTKLRCWNQEANHWHRLCKMILLENSILDSISLPVNPGLVYTRAIILISVLYLRINIFISLLACVFIAAVVQVESSFWSFIQGLLFCYQFCKGVDPPWGSLYCTKEKPIIITLICWFDQPHFSSSFYIFVECAALLFAGSLGNYCVFSAARCNCFSSPWWNCCTWYWEGILPSSGWSLFPRTG